MTFKTGDIVIALPLGSSETLTPEQLLDHDPYEGSKDPVFGVLEIEKIPADYDFNAPSYLLFVVDNTIVDPLTIETYQLSAAGGNPYHDELGRFTTGESSSAIRNFGMDDWPKDRRDTVLRTVSRLNEKYGVTKKYGVEFSINAGIISNSAVQTGSLAAVEGSTPTHIDIHPEMDSQNWLEQNDPGTTVSSNNLEHIIIHEFGHSIEATMPSRLRKELIKPFEEAQHSLFALEDGEGDGAKFNDLITKVSKYAGDNVNEGVAEAFLQHELGIHNEYSDHVGAVIAKWKE